MATQTVSQLPTVVPFPKSIPAVESISQLEIELLLSLRGRLSQLQTEVANAEASLKTRLEKGASVEAGDHIAELNESFRRNVSWKEVSARLARRLKMDGAAYCNRVIAATKPSRTVSLSIN